MLRSSRIIVRSDSPFEAVFVTTLGRFDCQRLHGAFAKRSISPFKARHQSITIPNEPFLEGMTVPGVVPITGRKSFRICHIGFRDGPGKGPTRYGTRILHKLGGIFLQPEPFAKIDQPPFRR